MNKPAPIIIFLLILTAFSVSSAGSGGGGGAAVRCDKDKWTCSSWGVCQKDGTQTRTCTLTYDCPLADTPKPAETATCTYVSKMLSSLKCHNLNSLKERVDCRLSLNEDELDRELSIAYLPEECRMLADEREKEDCVLLYVKSRQCWNFPIGRQRRDCLKNILNIEDINEEKKKCGNDNTCLYGLKRKVYALIKFAFYDLEERAEKLYEEGAISKDEAVGIIAYLEQKKADFNKANSKAERKQLILDVKSKWIDFVKGLR